jgi:caffeoyl-CoA O-methyltransferase
MPKRSLLPEAVDRYVTALSTESAVATRLRAETSKLKDANMQIGPDQAAFLSLLVRSIGARRALEVGTFTGMSALAVASALPEDGRLVCCDVSDEWTAIGRRFWREAGVESKIDLRLAPALDTLRALRKEGVPSFDFAFIDADKAGYPAYYEECLALVRVGGLVAIDNTLWHGSVADPDDKDEAAGIIRDLNAKVAGDARVEACLLTIGDGVMLARKR